MRRAGADTFPPRMTAEGDSFALLVAAIGIAAIAGLEIDQRKMPRHDFDAAQLRHFRRIEHRYPRHELGNMALAWRVKPWLFGFRRPFREMQEVVGGPL